MPWCWSSGSSAVPVKGARAGGGRFLFTEVCYTSNKELVRSWKGVGVDILTVGTTVTGNGAISGFTLGASTDTFIFHYGFFHSRNYASFALPSSWSLNFFAYTIVVIKVCVLCSQLLTPAKVHLLSNMI